MLLRIFLCLAVFITCIDTRVSGTPVTSGLHKSCLLSDLSSFVIFAKRGQSDYEHNVSVHYVQLLLQNGTLFGSYSPFVLQKVI